MRIRTKLILIYLIGASLTSITAAFAIRSYRSIESDFTVVINDPIKKLESLKKVERSVFRIIASTSEFGLILAEKKEEAHSSPKKQENIDEEDSASNKDSLDANEEKELMTVGYKNYHEAFAEYESLVKNSENEKEDYLDDIRKCGNQLLEKSSQLVKLKQEGVSGKEILEKKEELEIAEQLFLSSVEKSLKHQYDELSEKQANVNQTISESTTNTLTISAFAFIFAIAGGFIFSRSITKPLNKLQNASNRIGNGDLDFEIDLKTKDEIGELAEDFYKMTLQLKSSRDEILSGKDFVENILVSMADMLIAVDDNGIIERVNQSTLNLLGYQSNEIVGKPISFLTQQKTFLTEEEFAEMMKNKKLIEVEKDFVCKNGRKVRVLISSSILQGRTASAVVVAKDISELIKARQSMEASNKRLRQSNRELQDFAYVASHDLQEPLRKVQAFGNRLETKFAENLNDEGRDYIRRMREAASRMQRLINDLLTFSRVTTKAQPFQSVDLNKVAEEVLSDLEVRIEETNAKVEISELPEVEADPTQIRQLMQNLIGNALKFQQSDKKPQIRVYAENFSHNSASFTFNGQTVETVGSSNKFCQIIVQDNGIGFDEKYLDRIFTVFQRLHGRTEYEGSGVGLAVCRKIVERHGGTITARSKEGQGTSFMVTLPIIQIQEELTNNEKRF